MSRTDLMEEHQRTFDKVIMQMQVVELAENEYNKPYVRTEKIRRLWKIYLQEKRELEDLQFKCKSIDERLMKHVPITIKMTYNNQTL
jgi:hypothetical protein